MPSTVAIFLGGAALAWKATTRVAATADVQMDFNWSFIGREPMARFSFAENEGRNDWIQAQRGKTYQQGCRLGPALTNLLHGFHGETHLLQIR
jgi:hypothetical protein